MMLYLESETSFWKFENINFAKIERIVTFLKRSCSSTAETSNCEGVPVEEQRCCELQESQIAAVTNLIRTRTGLNDRLYLDRYAKFGFISGLLGSLLTVFNRNFDQNNTEYFEKAKRS